MSFITTIKQEGMRMAKFTIELYNLIESGFDLGLREYPIFDETYRNVLNKKLIQHYYMREIGFETAGLFKFMLNKSMNEIMPYYNQLYESVKIFKEKNPFEDKNITESSNRKNKGTSSQTGTGTTTSEDLDVRSDTPQSMLAIGDIKNNTYASDASWDNANATSSSTNDLTVDNTEDYINTIVGTNGGKNYSEMLLDWRNTFLNIDMMVIEDRSIKDCFMLVYEGRL